MSLLRTFVARNARSFLTGRVASFSIVEREISFPENLTAPLTEEEIASGDWVEVRIPAQEATLEWALSSPPPLHAFDEPPLFHECTEDSACNWENPLAH